MRENRKSATFLAAIILPVLAAIVILIWVKGFGASYDLHSKLVKHGDRTDARIIERISEVRGGSNSPREYYFVRYQFWNAYAGRNVKCAVDMKYITTPLNSLCSNPIHIWPITEAEYKKLKFNDSLPIYYSSNKTETISAPEDLQISSQNLLKLLVFSILLALGTGSFCVWWVFR